MSDAGCCSYLASDVGRMKIMTVVVGLAAVVVLSNGAFNASYATFSSNCKGGCPAQTDGCPSRLTLWTGYLIVLTCFGASTIVLVLIMLMFTKMMEHRLIKSFDKLGHGLAGILCVAVGLYCIYWTFEAFMLNKCGDGSSPQCSDQRSAKMSPFVIGAAGIMIVVLGVIYIVALVKMIQKGTATAPAAEADAAEPEPEPADTKGGKGKAPPKGAAKA